MKFSHRTALLLFFIFLRLPNGTAQSNWTIEKLPGIINSPYDEIAPVPSRDGRTLYFTRVGYPVFDRTLIFDTINYAVKLNDEKYQQMLGRLYTDLGQTVMGSPWKSSFNQDIWMAHLDSMGSPERITHPGYPLNNALTNSLVTITPDPNAFYIVNQFKPEGDMKRGFSIIRKQNDSTWLFPRPISIKDYYTITSDINLTMSFDGKVLILSAARFDSRDLDLYICFKEGEDQWSAPQHLGNIINSGRREMTPYLSENNRTLYFASDRAGSGGLDLYMTRREGESWMEWSAPIQLIKPINSNADESQPYFNMTSGYLYFTSKRDGNSDIFKVSIAPPQPTEIVIKGRIIDAQTKFQLTECQVQYYFEGNERQLISAPDGTFTIKIPKGVPVWLTGIKNGFNGIKQEALFRQDYYYFKDFYTIELEMTPLEEGHKIALQPIFFEQSKATILEQSFPELVYLADILKNAPTMKILIEGHTDNIGKAEDLLQLSLDRANAVKDFLVEHGIEINRIETSGQGANSPINDNSTEELKKANRRVEVHITKL